MRADWSYESTCSCYHLYSPSPLFVTSTVPGWRLSALDRNRPPITAIGWCLDVCHKKNTNVSRRQEFFRRWTVSLELSACRITWQRYLTCTVSETFEDILVCVGLQRMVTVAFLRRVQIFLLTYLLTQPESWHSLYHPTENRRLSWPRHYSKGEQPKAVYHSGFCDKHTNCLPWHSILWSHAPPSGMLQPNHCDLMYEERKCSREKIECEARVFLHFVL